MWLKNLARRFIFEESGQSTTEYILILAVVVVIASRFRTTIGEKMTQITDRVFNKISETVAE